MATAKKAVDSRSKTTTRSRRAAQQVEAGPRYQVLSDSFLNNQRVPAGSEVTFFGLPGRQLKPINAEAKSRKEQVRKIRTNGKLSAEEKLDQLRALSNEWNGVEDEAAWDVEEEEELSTAERKELEKHAQASVDATREAERDNTNAVRVQLQGDPANPKGTDVSNQGATPVTDGKPKR